MTNQQISAGMGYAERISQELACARAFAGKHDPQLQWDVNYHVQAARLLLESLAHELGRCRAYRACTGRSSMSKHTPLPWKMVSDPNFDNGNVYTSVQPVNVAEETMKPMAMMNGEYHVCRMSHTAAPWRFEYHMANAEFIVEACNSYYENRAALAAKDAEIAALEKGLAEWQADCASLAGEASRLREALKFYGDAWCFTTNPKRAGLEWKPKEALLDDCGNAARAALNQEAPK